MFGGMRVLLATSLLLLPLGSGASISTVLLDASNLQLNFAPGKGELPVLASRDAEALPERLATLSSRLESASVLAVFDGASFGGDFAGADWVCDRLSDTAVPPRVLFTDGRRTSADDELVLRLQEIGNAECAASATRISSGAATVLLERPPGDDPTPVIGATLLKSAAGKSKRQRREAFLRSCGLTRMGDQVHLPSFTPSQRTRSLSLLRAIHKIEPGVVRVSRLEQPAAIIVSDDRGLRRRCFALASPPVVLGRAQFFNWLEQEERARLTGAYPGEAEAPLADLEEDALDDD